MGMVEPRCSKVAIGRASRVVTRMRTRQGMATRRLVRVIRVRTPASPRAARVAVYRARTTMRISAGAIPTA